MTKTLSRQIASFALAALMTLGMLAGIDAFAKVESRLGAVYALIAQAKQQAAHA